MSHCVKGILALFPRRGRTACRPIICSALAEAQPECLTSTSVHRSPWLLRSVLSAKQEGKWTTCPSPPPSNPGPSSLPVYCGQDPKHVLETHLPVLPFGKMGLKVQEAAVKGGQLGSDDGVMQAEMGPGPGGRSTWSSALPSSLRPGKSP